MIIIKAICSVFWFNLHTSTENLHKDLRRTYIFVLLIHTRTCAYQGVKNVGFIKEVSLNILGLTQNCVYILNEWSLVYREIIISHTAETHLEPIQTFNIEPFAERVTGFQPLMIYAKSSTLDAWLSSNYTSIRIQFWLPGF